MGKHQPHMVTDAIVNVRSAEPFLILDGEPFPYYVSAAHPIELLSGGKDVHVVKVAIQVDRSVTFIDGATLGDVHYRVPDEPSERLQAALAAERDAQLRLMDARTAAANALRDAKAIKGDRTPAPCGCICVHCAAGDHPRSCRCTAATPASPA